MQLSNPLRGAKGGRNKVGGKAGATIVARRCANCGLERHSLEGRVRAGCGAASAPGKEGEVRHSGV